MKIATAAATTVLCLPLAPSLAFSVLHRSWASAVSILQQDCGGSAPRMAALLAAVELEPEPEDGEELTPLKSLPDCRMKRLRQLDGGSDNREVYQFWMTAVAEGELVKSIRAQILKDASKKANFPGFRKGQVPPYAQPQITQFAVQEGIIKTVEAAVEAYGLQSLEGSEGQVTVHEDVAAMAKGYQTGQSLPFTATLNATMAAEETPGDGLQVDDASADDIVMDVSAESVAVAEE